MNSAFLAATLLLASGQSTPDGLVDPNVAKSQAVSYERRLDWDQALVAWQSILDRSEPSDDLRLEAIAHVHDLNLKTKPANLSLPSAKPWPSLVVVFRNMSVDWKDEKGEAHHFQSHFKDEEIRSIRKGFDTFRDSVFRFTSGLVRIDPTFRVVDEPVTSVEGKGSFWVGLQIPKPTLLRLLKGVDYQSVFTYEKYNEGDRRLPRAMGGGTFGADQGLNGPAFSEILWDEREPNGGEVELHEWLHQIDWMFTSVLGYPQAASVNPDTGRKEGDAGGDPDFRRPPSAINWMDFYRHIMEDHVTRTMWKEATMTQPQANPWLKRRLGTRS